MIIRFQDYLRRRTAKRAAKSRASILAVTDAQIEEVAMRLRKEGLVSDFERAQEIISEMQTRERLARELLALRSLPDIIYSHSKNILNPLVDRQEMRNSSSSSSPIRHR